MDLFGKKARAELERMKTRIFKEQLANDMAKMYALRKQHELEVELAVTKERLRLLIEEGKQKMLPPAPADVRVHKTEDEEEADYALRTGQIDLSEYRKLMEEQGFQNTEIELAPAYPSDIRY